MNSQYWIKRQSLAFDETFAVTHDLYAESYRKAMRLILEDVSSLYDEILKESANGEIKINDLYRYNRFFAIKNRINKRLQELGARQIEITDNKLLEMYYRTQELVDDSLSLTFSSDSLENAKAVVNEIWCADGKSWSQRIWKQMDALQQALSEGIFNCVATGQSKDKLVAQLQRNFSVSFSNADRITRTELTHVQNKGAAERLKAHGIKEYKYLATDDGRTDDECANLNGKVFSFDVAAVGINFPPMHPACRCCIIPVVGGKK